MMLKKTAAVLLAATMVVTVAGCSSDKSWAAQLGEQKISAGVYSLNLMTGLNEAARVAGMTLEPGASDIFKADIDGKTGSQYIIDFAKEETMRQLAVDKKFAELELTISDEEKKSYEDYAKEMYATDAEMFKSIGVSEQSVIDYNRFNYQNYLVFSKVYSEGGEKAPTAGDADKYFAENYYTCYAVPFLKVDPTTGAPLEGDALTAVQSNADAALKTINEGKSIVDVVHEESNKQLPEGSEPYARGEDTDYVMVVDKANMSGSFPPVLTEHLATAAVGSVQKIEDDQFVILVQKLDETKPNAEMSNYYYTQMLPQLKNDEYRALMLEWANGYGITFNDAAIKHYTGEKIKKDTDAYLKTLEAASSSSAPAVDVPQLSIPDTASSEPAASSDTGSSSSAG